MTLKRVIRILLLLALPVACTKQPAAEEPIAIGFSASLSDDLPLTRAAGEIDGDAALRAAGFGVFACYTGLHTYAESSVTPDFMFNQHVHYSGGHWEYEPVKYWPAGEGEITQEPDPANPHHVSFFAYAPYSDGSRACIPSFIRVGEMGDPWLLYRLADDPAEQVDLLYATPLLDQTRPSIGARLNFSFRHALACVGEKVSVALGDDLRAALLGEVTAGTIESARVVLQSVKVTYTLTAKGRLNLWNRGQANWTALTSEDVVTTRSQTLLSGGSAQIWTSAGDASSPWEVGDKGIFCVPVEAPGYPQKAVVDITFIIYRTQGGQTAGTERQVSSEVQLKTYLSEGKTTDLNIKLNK